MKRMVLATQTYEAGIKTKKQLVLIKAKMVDAQLQVGLKNNRTKLKHHNIASNWSEGSISFW